MEATASRKLNCQICGRAFLPQNGAIGDNVRPSLAEFIKSHRPNWDPHQFICFGDLGAFRRDYVKHTLECEIGELTSLDQEVIESLREHEVLTENIEKQFERLFEIQQIQIELLEEISQRKRGAPRESPRSPDNSLA